VAQIGRVALDGFELSILSLLSAGIDFRLL
jgi:hypothetical protein